MSSSYPTKAAARKAGNRFKSLLNKPRGWKVDVWTTCPTASSGWHARLVNGPLALHTSFDDTFYALLSDNPEDASGGFPAWSTRFTHANPNKVIARQLRTARPVADRIARAVAHVESLI